VASVFHFFFSPEGAGWGYPFLGWPGFNAIVVSIVLIAVALPAVRLGLARVESREREVLAGLVIVGFLAQLLLRSLGPTTPAAVIASPGSNGFLTVAQRYGPIEFLSQFHTLIEQLPMHVRANLPGKTLAFHALLVVTGSTEVMGYLILLASTCGALLAYFLARQWFADRRVAFCAAVLYVFMPARIYFLPVMNVLTPVLALLPLCLLEWYFSHRRVWVLLAAGVSIYALVIFEPLPLALAPIALGQLARRYRAGELGRSDLARVAAYPIVAIFTVYVLMRAAFGFDTVRAFMDALEDARAFNAATARPYALWVFHNLKDFFLHAGVAQSALFFAGLWQVSVNRARIGDRWILFAFAFIVVVLDVLGVNRGETVRLWIFLGVVLQILAARECGGQFRAVAIVVALSILQTALLMPAIGWIEVAAAP
jgi:ABC-type glycerol-3-phosphate transport system permease component